MDTMEAIFARRSVREYADKPVPDDLIQLLLKAAMNAPSAADERPWHFVALKDRDVLKKIPSFHPYAQMAGHAPAAILICGDEKLETCPGFWPQDCSAAAENLWIAATAQGLGCVWVGVYPVQERVAAMRKLLGIPEHVVPFALMVLGYPAKPPKDRASRHDPSRVHHDKW